MTSSTVRTYVHVCQCDQYHASLQHTPLCFDQLTPAKTRYPLTSFTWPYRGLKLGAHRVQLFLILTAYQVLVFDWIAGSTQVNSPKHERGCLIFRALSVARRGYTSILRQLDSSYTVNAFRVQVENGLQDIFFLHFSLVSIQFDISWYLWSTLVATQLFKSSIGAI